MISYDQELAKTRDDIRALESKAHSDTQGPVERIRLAYRRFHLASLTEAESDYKPVEEAVRELIQEFGPQEDVCLLQANIDGRFHRLGEAKQALALSPSLTQRPSGRAILADIDFQEGRYQQSLDTLNALLDENRTWDILARLAHWQGKMGDPHEADRLYEEAEEELTAKEMRSFAWLELQRGALALSYGEFNKARLHYDRASTAFPGHWRTDEHNAALTAATGNLAGAATLLRSVIRRTPKPELKQALGELLTAQGKNEEARGWLETAATEFLASVEEGGVHYYHHLADIYADALDHAAQAVHWARKDLQLRSNFATQSALAWALYKNAELTEGLHWIRIALSSGVQDRGVFTTAAALFHATGDPLQGSQYEQAALKINPTPGPLHLHH
jgi:tetratricopeptide (TPR) repeat protein